MNIRDHVRSELKSLPASFAQRGGQAGVIFHDENEFIPFDDLNYNSEYGYYRLSQFPNLQRDCTNENPETLHYGKDFPDWKLFMPSGGGNFAELISTPPNLDLIYFGSLPPAETENYLLWVDIVTESGFAALYEWEED